MIAIFLHLYMIYFLRITAVTATVRAVIVAAAAVIVTAAAVKARFHYNGFAAFRAVSTVTATVIGYGRGGNWVRPRR
jgi:hypothetical protein